MNRDGEYSGRRRPVRSEHPYGGGQRFLPQGVLVEFVVAEHARELFGAEYAYAQPHSGIDANLTAYWAILAHHIEAPALARSLICRKNYLATYIPAVFPRPSLIFKHQII